jgi:voltage-gated potassium channel
MERRVVKIASGPVSVRNALSAIVVGTTVVVLTSAIAIRLLDHEEYKSYGKGLWWAIQTVTTVGYGDVTPAHRSGRLVAAVVMLWGTAYLAILTATITSTFVTRAQIEDRLDALDARLESIEQALGRLAGD